MSSSLLPFMVTLPIRKGDDSFRKIGLRSLGMYAKESSDGSWSRCIDVSVTVSFKGISNIENASRNSFTCLKWALNITGSVCHYVENSSCKFSITARIVLLYQWDNFYVQLLSGIETKYHTSYTTEQDLKIHPLPSNPPLLQTMSWNICAISIRRIFSAALGS